MALKAERQTHQLDHTFQNPFETERGGFASIVTLSGVQYATYDPDPNDSSIPLGIQQFDFEAFDLAIETPRWLIQNAYPIFTLNAIMLEGEVITNFIHPDVTSITPGQFAFLAPSGFVTPTPVFTNLKVGRFLSALNDPSLGNTVNRAVRLGGTTNSRVGTELKTNTAGWAKLRIQVQ